MATENKNSVATFLFINFYYFFLRMSLLRCKLCLSMKYGKKEIIVFVLIALMFIASSYFSFKYFSLLNEFIQIKGVIGMFLYVLLEISSIVIVPITTFPLLPIAVVIWGSLIATILNITGWMIGASIAFWLARKYGRPFVSRFIKVEQINRLEKMVQRENIFWSIVILRMSMPTDILSYTLGLFTNIPMNVYLVATFFGLVPFAFIFAYSVSLSIWHQIGALALSAALIYYGYNRSK